MMKGVNFSIKTVMVMAIAVGVLAIVGLMASTQLENIGLQVNDTMSGALQW